MQLVAYRNQISGLGRCCWLGCDRHVQTGAADHVRSGQRSQTVPSAP